MARARLIPALALSFVCHSPRRVPTRIKPPSSFKTDPEGTGKASGTTEQGLEEHGIAARSEIFYFPIRLCVSAGRRVRTSVIRCGSMRAVTTASASSPAVARTSPQGSMIWEWPYLRVGAPPH